MKKIKLTKGYHVIVDKEDYESLSKFSWYVLIQKEGTPYAVRTTYINKKPFQIRMHREILNAEKGQIIDHIDGDGLNNKRNNLRFCTHSQNMMNRKTNETRGISFHKPTGKWQAKIGINKQQIYLGLFVDKDDAKKAYQNASKKYHKDFRRK